MKSVLKNKGWTLVEVLITTVIFAIISSISYMTINSSLLTENIYKKNNIHLNELQNTLNFIQRDMMQIYYNDIELNKNDVVFSSIQNNKLLEIAYSVDDNKLIREDRTNKNIPIIKLHLIDKIKNLKIRILDNKNKWHTSSKQIKSIKAIEIKFKHEYWGEILKLVAVQ